LSNIQPEDLSASPWRPDNFYFFYDLTVAKEGEKEVIYECQSSNYCSQDPTSDLGKKGWVKTPYDTAHIAKYEEVKPDVIAHWFDMSQVWASKFPWIKNDVTRTSDGYFKCQDSLKCRSMAPLIESSEVWAKVENRFPVKFNRENEVETPPEALYTVPCSKLVVTETYKLD